MIRKVTGVSTAGGGAARGIQSSGVRSQSVNSLVLQTEQANLTDVFKELNFHDSRNLGPEDFTVTTAPGVTLQRTLKASSRRDPSGPTTFTFTVTKADPFGAGKSEISGQIQLKLSADTDMQIDEQGVKLVRFVPSIEQRLAVTVSLKRMIDAGPEMSLRLADLSGTPILVPPTPLLPVPVVLLPKLELFLKAKGSIEGGIKAGVSVTATLSAGAQYTRDEGWSGIASGSSTGSTDPINIYGDMSVTAGPAADVAFYIYGVVGPTISIGAPNVKLALKANTNPASIKFTTDIVAKASAKVKVEILGILLGEYDPGELINQTWPISEKTFLPGDAVIGVQ